MGRPFLATLSTVSNPPQEGLSKSAAAAGHTEMLFCREAFYRSRIQAVGHYREKNISRGNSQHLKCHLLVHECTRNTHHQPQHFQILSSKKLLKKRVTAFLSFPRNPPLKDITSTFFYHHLFTCELFKLFNMLIPQSR